MKLSVLLHRSAIGKTFEEVRMISGLIPTGMTYLGNSSIPPSPHFMWCECLELLQIASHLDSGSDEYNHDCDNNVVVMKYQGTTGQHDITFKALREAEHKGDAIWVIDGKEFELLEYVPAKPTLTEFQKNI